jgi:hypothetical protein
MAYSSQSAVQTPQCSRAVQTARHMEELREPNDSSAIPASPLANQYGAQRKSDKPAHFFIARGDMRLSAGMRIELVPLARPRIVPVAWS